LVDLRAIKTNIVIVTWTWRVWTYTLLIMAWNVWNAARLCRHNMEWMGSVLRKASFYADSKVARNVIQSLNERI